MPSSGSIRNGLTRLGEALLRQLLTGAEWTEHAEAIESSLVLDVLKQSEVLASSPR